MSSPVLFDLVRRQLERLIPLFEVSRQTSCILTSFDTLCCESLDIDLRRRAPEFSRINADGTPFQFALTLGGNGPAPLQFLSEAGRPGCCFDERLSASYRCLKELARTCGLLGDAERLVPALRELTPETDPHLVADASGIFWFALSFSRHAAPSLTAYINGFWGGETAQWQRLDRFAEFFGSSKHWHSLAALARPVLSPLGVAVTLRPDKPPKGRIYLHTFGASLDVYRTLFLQWTTAPSGRAETFDEFGRHMLGQDIQYPTGSGVFSCGLPDVPLAGAKFELCAHCAFPHDAEAASRIACWLQQLGADDEIYAATIATLTRGRPLCDHALPSLHAYVGLGACGSDHCTSVYLNPGPLLEWA